MSHDESTIQCAACGQANRAGRRFCAQCGVRFDLVCAACGERNEPGERFCGQCGVAIGEGDPRALQLQYARSRMS